VVEGVTLKVLFVHEVSYTKKPIYEMHEFPEYLARRGHEIVFFEFDEGRKFWVSGSEAAQQIENRVFKDAKVSIQRPLQLGVPGIDRLLVMLTSIPRLRSLLKGGGFDVVVLYAVPTYGIQTLYFARKNEVPVIFRALDVSHKIRSSFLAPFIKMIERHVYRKAKLVSANNSAMENYCKSLAGREIGSTVNYPPLDLEHFEASHRDEDLRIRLGILENEQVVCYMGTFFYFSGLVGAMTQFARRSKESPQIKFLLIGGGEQAKELEELARGLGIEQKVIFTGFVAYRELPRYLKLADIAINPLIPSLVAHVAFPNKVLQYLASGLVVASTPLRGLMTVFQESKNIVWGDTPDLVMDGAIDYLQSLSNKIERRDRSVSSEDLSLFYPPRTVEHFEETLLSLIAKKP
jgi:glycosyltransferase involved in cell wall biosynthesis